MSTSLLYHAFSVRSYEHLRTEYRQGAIYEHIQKKPYAQRCSACRYPGVTQQGRSVVTVPIIHSPLTDLAWSRHKK